MTTYNSVYIKAWDSKTGKVSYYGSYQSCCIDNNIRYKESLKKLIQEGGLAPDGRTFFDEPTEYEIAKILDGTIPIL